ncbi:hypothetical protein HDU86_005698 [Geranomyces michiganensis]|nr:hypothetical protein HDU86_005698 [Geranomyces michiganensis]
MSSNPLDFFASAGEEHRQPADDGTSGQALTSFAGAASPGDAGAAVKTLQVFAIRPVSGAAGTIFEVLLPASCLFDAAVYSIAFGHRRVNAECSYDPDGKLRLTAMVPPRLEAFLGDVHAGQRCEAPVYLISEQGGMVLSGLLGQFEYEESLVSDYMQTPTSATTQSELWSSPSVSPAGSPRIKTEPRLGRPPLKLGYEGYYCVIDSSVSSLHDIRKWSYEEINSGRILVRAHVWEDAPRTCYFERVSPAAIQTDDMVVSCILWDGFGEEDDSQAPCFITSVDLISLLEFIMDVRLAVPQKNRIRRNLESLSPITVSKHKPDTSEFFVRIMSYDEPRPRNIEKDVKVFAWAQVKPALEKILSKMTDCGEG